jgi:hypothetical protein
MTLTSENKSPQNILLLMFVRHWAYKNLTYGLALGYGLDDRGFESRQGLGIFLFMTASRPGVGPPSLLANG